MIREYVYGKLGQTEEANISDSDSDGSLELNSSPARRFLSRYRNALNYLLVALLVIASFFTGFFVHPVTSTSNLPNGHSAHEDAIKEAGNARAFLPQCGFDISLPRGSN